GPCTAGGGGIRLDRQGRVVLAGHGHLGDRRQVLPDGLQILRLLIHVLVLSLAGDHPRERENADRYGDQQADDEAESIEKMGVLLAHDVFRVGLPEKALCKSARKYIRSAGGSVVRSPASGQSARQSPRRLATKAMSAGVRAPDRRGCRKRRGRGGPCGAD